MRTLHEFVARVSGFVKNRVEDISFRDLEILLCETEGDKPRDVPIFSSIPDELRLQVGDRDTGWLFRSRQGGYYSKWRVQQIVNDVASDAGIQKRMYPRLLRHTVAQHLADGGTHEELLHQFLEHKVGGRVYIVGLPGRLGGELDRAYLFFLSQGMAPRSQTSF